MCEENSKEIRQEGQAYSWCQVEGIEEKGNVIRLDLFLYC